MKIISYEIDEDDYVTDEWIKDTKNLILHYKYLVLSLFTHEGNTFCVKRHAFDKSMKILSFLN